MVNALTVTVFLIVVILNITRLGLALKCFHCKRKRNGDNVNLIVIVALNTVSGNQASKRIVTYKKTLGKIYFYQERAKKGRNTKKTTRNKKTVNKHNLNVYSVILLFLNANTFFYNNKL